MALASRAVGRIGKAAAIVALLGIISAALFYGDAVITPALSVLSAVEGIDVATPAFHDFVVPLTVVILMVLFAFQSRGTARGCRAVRSDHGDLVCRDCHSGRDARWRPIPVCYGRSIRSTAWNFSWHHGMIGLFTLGAVFLAVTGAEALYADLGHFGRPPIQVAWFGLVLPALGDQLSGAGRAGLRASGSGRQSVLFALPRLGAHPDGGAGHGGHRDREPGGDHRRLFADQPGYPARASAAVRNSPHLGAAGRPNLHAARQRLAAGRRAAPGRAVPLVERARLGLWHRRHRHHGGHRHDGVHRHLADVALVAAGGGGLDCCRSW